MNILVFRVKVVNYHICVACVTGCEYNNLEVFTQISEDLFGVWPDIYAGLNYLTCWKFDG
jgi:hypothetical protein